MVTVEEEAELLNPGDGLVGCQSSGPDSSVDSFVLFALWLKESSGTNSIDKDATTAFPERLSQSAKDNLPNITQSFCPRQAFHIYLVPCLWGRHKGRLEMKAELKIQWRRCLEFSFTVLQLVLIVASISFAAPLIGNANYFCNATGGDCHEEPPCVDSDPCPGPPIGSQLRYITYHSLGKQPICNSKIYGSCLRPEGSNKTERCSYYTRCRLHS